MAVTFGIRGDSFTPRYNGTGGPDYGLGGASPPTIETNAGAIGGEVLFIANGGGATYQNVSYNGVGNWPATKAVSVNISLSFPALITTLSLWHCGAPDTYASLEAYIDATNITIRMANEIGQVGINSVTFAHGGLSVDTFYDITVTYSGDATTDGCTVYLDGSSLGTTTSTREWDATRPKLHRHLGLGFGDVANNAYMEVQEFTIWDSVISPSSVGLTSGSGSLNGASRTAYVDVAAFDGAASTGGSAPKLGYGGFLGG